MPIFSPFGRFAHVTLFIKRPTTIVSTIDSLLKAVPRELRFETELLIAEALNWNRARVLAFSETEITGAALAQLERTIIRLVNGEPFAYIKGQREFYGLEFHVTPAVLIPRPDTELLVELAIEHCPDGAYVVDLGTGSGAIAISLGNERQDLHLTATDNSEPALDIARLNAARHNCCIAFVLSNWFERLTGKFDVILSNPPYIRPDDPHLAALRHEPESALIAQDKGLADISKIVSGAPKALKPQGKLLIEHGYDQANEVQALLKTHGFHCISTHHDLAGQPRVTSGSLVA